MIPTPQTWMRWAALVMPQSKIRWLHAMKAELAEISNPAVRNSFAIGCFKTAFFERIRSRKGLHYIARVGGATFIFVMCIMGVLSAGKLGLAPEMLAVSKIITYLCLFYMCGSALLLVSLRGLKFYAGLGFVLAAIGWLYHYLAQPNYEHLSIDFMKAINFEAAGLMAGLFLMAIYLDWLYTPGIDDV